MKSTGKRFFTGMILILFLSPGLSKRIFADSLPAHFRVLPKPREVELLQGAGLEYGALRAIRLQGEVPRPVLGPILSALPAAGRVGDGSLTLRLSNDAFLPESKEGYVLRIGGKGVEVDSRGEAGLFYGCQTLEQLLEDARDAGKPIPACRIIDTPGLSYRAVHMDVKHHLDTMKYYYDSVDRLARYKINAIIFEFEDKLRYRRRPLVGAPQAMSIDEVAALTRYAAERHVEITPLVQGLGHATFILKHDKYADLREDPESLWAFCPLEERGYEVLFDMYRDAFDATPGSRYLHVGGDEVGEIGRCLRCKPAAERGGKLALNLHWLRRVCEFAQKHGRIPIFWDDMIFKYAGVYGTTHRDMEPGKVAALWEKGEPTLDSVLERYPKECIYMRWNYTLARQEGNLRALEWYRKRGLKAMIATAAQNVHPLFPQDDRVNIIQSFISVAEERGILGMLCTAWDDSSPHMETYWRGLIASAEFGWFPKGRSLREFETAYLHRAFGPECTDATSLYADLFQAVAFWNRALCARGNRRRVDRLMDLPDPAAPGKWSAQHEARLSIAEKESERHARLAEQLKNLEARATRNHYHLELLSAVNRFQVTAPHLLLALRACDTDESGKRAKGMKKVRDAMEEFDGAWKDLLRVYKKTRFISYPPEYVKDRYFHFASQSEDLTWMIQVETRYHALVRKWLESNARG